MEQFKSEQFPNQELNKTPDTVTIEQTKSPFETQFAKKENLDGVPFVKIKSEEKNDKNPVLFAPGWSRTLDTFKDALRVLHENGRDVISLNQPRIDGEINGNEKTNDYPTELLRRATSLRKIIDNEVANGNEEIDMVAQSMGGMDAVVAILLSEADNPGKIKNLVLVNPAGMIGEDSMLELGLRFTGQIKQNKAVTSDEDRPQSAKDNVKIAGEEFLKYVKENPLRAVKEISAMSNFQIIHLLEDIKNMGIGISIIHGVDDLTFPMDRVQKNANTNQLDGFYSVKGGHNELYLNPEKYMKLAEHALTALKLKNEKPHSV